MAQIVGAILLLGCYFAAALTAMFLFPNVVAIPDVARVCYAAVLDDQSCRAGAIHVAAVGLTTIGLVVIATYGFAHRSPPGVRASLRRMDARRQGVAFQAFILLLLTAVALVMTIHNFAHAPTGLDGKHYRPAEAAFVSLESLAWPLVLQVVFWVAQIRWKILLVAFLAALAAILPFRNAIFSMFYFGAIVPLSVPFVSGVSLRRKGLISIAAIAGLVIAASLILMYETGQRTVGTEYQAKQSLPPSEMIARRLVSRSLTPFFQTVLVGRQLQSGQQLPGFMATVEQKFHRKQQTLNEYLYDVLYHGTGQTTTLYYGESVANTPIPPIFWNFAAPLALVLSYFILRPFCDVGVLIAIALWRSSMGGLFDIIPALALQVGFCLVLSYLGNQWRAMPPVGAQAA